MKLHRRLRRAALADLDEAAEWYAGRAEGLAERFLDAVEIALDRIESNPKAYQRVQGGLRRAPLPPPFPHQVFYLLRGQNLEIYAVLHPARDPAVWKRRM